MQCPVDQAELMMTERQGVEIDYCPRCRGVWLDRGELDKIIERVGAPASPPEPAPFYPEPDRGARHAYRGDRDDDDWYDRRDGYRKKKRKSMLEDLFDF